jgi:hypothetical protein
MSGETNCERCGGRRVIGCAECEGRGVDSQGVACPRCNGIGTLACPRCDPGPASRSGYVDLGGRAALAIALLTACIVTSVVLAISTLFEIQLLKDAQGFRGGMVPADWEARTAANDLRQALLGFASTGILIVSAITFIRWLHRAYKNLPALGHTPTYTPGWAIGAWFVPILNLFRPFQITREVWVASDPSNGVAEARVPAKAGLVGVWWGAWIISNVLSQIAFRWSLEARTIENYLTADRISLVCTPVDILAGLLAILVVRGIRERQRQLHEEVNGPGFAMLFRAADALDREGKWLIVTDFGEGSSG